MTSKERNKNLPNYPSVAESGVPGFEAGSWFGLFAPAKTPSDVVQIMGAEAKRALTNAKIVARMDPMGFDVIASDPSEFTKFLNEEYEKWGKVVRDVVLKM